MGKGKYSPTVLRKGFGWGSEDYENIYIYNAKGEIPPDTWESYDVEIHFPHYDKDGFDSYGYSAYDKSGVYVDIGMGVDRNGYTEYDYMKMSDEEFAKHF